MMDKFIRIWAGRLKWVCAAFVVFDMCVGWYKWAAIMVVCAAVYAMIEHGLKDT